MDHNWKQGGAWIGVAEAGAYRGLPTLEPMKSGRMGTATTDSVVSASVYVQKMLLFFFSTTML